MTCGGGGHERSAHRVGSVWPVDGTVQRAATNAVQVCRRYDYVKPYATLVPCTLPAAAAALVAYAAALAAVTDDPAQQGLGTPAAPTPRVRVATADAARLRVLRQPAP